MIITSINEWKMYLESLDFNDTYFLNKDNYFVLTTKNQILAFAELNQTNDGLLFDKIYGPGYGAKMTKFVLMSQYPNYVRPSRSSKKQVIDIWDKLLKETEVKKTTKIWSFYDDYINPKSINRIQLLNQEYRLKPDAEYLAMVERSNKFISKMTELLPDYINKRIKVGKDKFALEYI